MSLSLWLKGGALVVDDDGQPILCDRCPCPTPTPTPTPTATPTPTPTPTPTAMPFPGAGWYCVLTWAGGDCGSLLCTGGSCLNITDQASWDTKAFGECWFDDMLSLWAMLTTDGVSHASEAECSTAGCGCPT